MMKKMKQRISEKRVKTISNSVRFNNFIRYLKEHLTNVLESSFTKYDTTKFDDLSYRFRKLHRISSKVISNLELYVRYKLNNFTYVFWHNKMKSKRFLKKYVVTSYSKTMYNAFKYLMFNTKILQFHFSSSITKYRSVSEFFLYNFSNSYYYHYHSEVLKYMINNVSKIPDELNSELDEEIQLYSGLLTNIVVTELNNTVNKFIERAIADETLIDERISEEELRERIMSYQPVKMLYDYVTTLFGSELRKRIYENYESNKWFHKMLVRYFFKRDNSFQHLLNVTLEVKL